jgi:hypothetical protein
MCHEVETPSGITEDLYQRVMDEVTYVFYNMYSYPSVKEAAKAGIGYFIAEMDSVSSVHVIITLVYFWFCMYSLECCIKNVQLQIRFLFNFSKINLNSFLF